MDREVNRRSVGTHDGTFHADEVTACALLLLFDLIDQDKIVRTRDLAKLAQCEFVCDVGGVYDPSQKKFDHHQVEYHGRLSSAGMVLKYLLDEQILNEKAYQFFNEAIIINVDDHDNGRELPIPGVCTYSHIISNFMPISYDALPEEQTAAFFEALQFAKENLTRLWKRYQYICSCREVVAEVMQKGGAYLAFDREIPWIDSFFDLGGDTHPAKFVIMPSGQHWKLRGIPPTYREKMKVRQPLPKIWSGLLAEELKEKSKIEGAVFCHKGRFISIWETKEDAIKAWEAVQQMQKGEV